MKNCTENLVVLLTAKVSIGLTVRASFLAPVEKLMVVTNVDFNLAEGCI